MKMKILIGYDGSDCARDAIEGLRLAGLPDEAEAVVISAADVLRAARLAVSSTIKSADPKRLLVVRHVEDDEMLMLQKRSLTNISSISISVTDY